MLVNTVLTGPMYNNYLLFCIMVIYYSLIIDLHYGYMNVTQQAILYGFKIQGDGLRGLVAHHNQLHFTLYCIVERGTTLALPFQAKMVVPLAPMACIQSYQAWDTNA